MKKKLFFVLTTLVMASLVACGGKGEGNKKESSKETVLDKSEMNDKTSEDEIETSETNTETTEVSEEELIEEFKKLIEEKKYEEAVDFYFFKQLGKKHNDTNDEVEKYYSYAEACRHFEGGGYVQSYDIFTEKCVDFLDSNDKIKQIEEKIFVLNGVYENKSVGYDGMFIYLKNGKACTDLIGTGEPNTPPASSAYYNYELSDYVFTTGESVFGIYDGYAAEMPKYVVQIMDDGSLLVLAPEGSSYSTFSGTYEKTSYPLPEET